MKDGAGTMVLSGNSTYAGATLVDAGTLLVNGSIAPSSGVTVALGATLGGTGVVPAVSGPGNVSPGTSAGILTAPAVAASDGMDFHFEFTQQDPQYGNPAASRNDVLRLTDRADPLIGPALAARHEINVYLDRDALAMGEVFHGGFYTDRRSDFLGEIADATLNYFVRSDGLGPATFEGASYYPLGAYGVDWYFHLATVPQTADFGQGPVDGYVMELTAAVPEPVTLALLALSAVGLGGYLRSSRAKSRGRRRA